MSSEDAPAVSMINQLPMREGKKVHADVRGSILAQDFSHLTPQLLGSIAVTSVWWVNPGPHQSQGVK